MTILPTAGELSASKSHKERRWTFVPTRDTSKPGLGIVTICQGKRDADSYAVDVEAGQVLFVKLDDAGDVYGVTCDRAGRAVKCNCQGYGRAKTCKHADVTRELIAEQLVAVA